MAAMKKQVHTVEAELEQLEDDYNKLDMEEKEQDQVASKMFSRIDAPVPLKKSSSIRPHINPIVDEDLPPNTDAHVRFSNIVAEKDPGDIVVNEDGDLDNSVPRFDEGEFSETLNADMTPSNGLPTKLAESILDALRRRPFAYQSLTKVYQGLVVKDESTFDAFSSEEYEHSDSEISYDDWCLAYEALLKAMWPYDHASSKLFRKHFENCKAYYSPAIWPSLRVYDIRVRLMHLGDTSNDLITLDKRLLGTTLIEDADESLHHFGTRAGIEDYFDHIGDDKPDAIHNESTNSSPVDPTVTPSRELRSPLGSDNSDDTDLAAFLDELYRGASVFTSELRKAGVTSKASLAEITMIDSKALDELLDPIKESGGISRYLKIVLKGALRRRFST